MDSYSQIHAITISILCLALGTLLLIANLPVLYALLASSKLRLRYAILALLLLAAAIGELRRKGCDWTLSDISIHIVSAQLACCFFRMAQKCLLHTNITFYWEQFQEFVRLR
uniref:Uncharacterized protein n=1 Tax=Brugia malayi TaxID=6279 RepID=A8NU03_BRUMA